MAHFYIYSHGYINRKCCILLMRIKYTKILIHLWKEFHQGYQPVPLPAKPPKNPYPSEGYGFLRVRVRVHAKVPTVYPCSSLVFGRIFEADKQAYKGEEEEDFVSLVLIAQDNDEGDD
jgi:hypothetical protein